MPSAVNKYLELGMDTGISLADIIGEPEKLRLIIGQKFKEKTQKEWVKIFDGKHEQSTAHF